MSYLLQATQQVRPLHPCPGEQKQRPGWDLRASRSYFPPLSPMSLANSGPRASCYLGFFQGTRLRLHPLKVSPSDSKHFEDLRMVAHLFKLPGQTRQPRGPHIHIPGNCSPGLPCPYTCRQRCLSVGTPRSSGRGVHTHACAGSVQGIPNMAACMCARALVDVAECARGLMGVCLCACVCRSVPTDPASLHMCDWSISGHRSMCIHFRGGPCVPLPTRSPWGPSLVTAALVFVCSCVRLTCPSTCVYKEEHTHAHAGSLGPVHTEERRCHTMSVCTHRGVRGSLCMGMCVLSQVDVCIFVNIQPQGNQARVYMFVYMLYQTTCTHAWKWVFVCMCVSVRARDPTSEVCVSGRDTHTHTHTHTLSGGQNVRVIDFLSLRSSL